MWTPTLPPPSHLRWAPKIKSFIIDILFPQFCFSCGREGEYLCEDCQATLEISGFHQKYPTQNLQDLYFAINYQNPLIKKLIQKFKYTPFVKELAKTFSSLIITHFQLMDNKPDFFYPVRDRRSSNGAGFVIMPVPLEKRKLRWRGFNQTKELAKELSQFLKIPLIDDVLIKIKETHPQVELSDELRKENIKGVFSCQNSEKIRGRKILLIDDVYTTGSTMEECAKILKTAGTKEIIGIVIARG